MFILRGVSFLITLVNVIGVAFAANVTPTGFYYPVGTDNPNVSQCGRWLTKPSPNGCYPTPGVYHIGVDLMANYGTSVRAIADGKVIDHIGVVSQAFGAGNLALLVEHESVEKGKFLFLYGHMQITGAKAKGSIVEAGKEIGKIGTWSGGNHLHAGLLTPGLSNALDVSAYGRWPYEKYGKVFSSEKPYFDNGFIDPIYFITHNGAKNTASCQQQKQTGLPEIITRDHVCFTELCNFYPADSRCDPSDVVMYTECVYERSTLCAVPSSMWSATGYGNSTSGNTDGAGGDTGGVPLTLPTSGTRTNTVPHVDVYLTTGDQHEISADCRTCATEPVTEGQIVRVKQTIEVKDADVRPWFRKDFNSVYSWTWWRIEDSNRNQIIPWTILFTRKFDPGRLEKGESYGESTNFTVPNLGGKVLVIASCSDPTDRVLEKNESTTRRSPAQNPDDCGTDNVSRKERFLIQPDPRISCGVITSMNWVSGGWSGLGYSAPFSTDGTILINPMCRKTRPNSLEVTIGNKNNSKMITYLTAYIQNKATGAYMPFSLTCWGAVNSGWCQGEATVAVENTGINTASSINPTLLFGYTCEAGSNGWVCPQGWQIQGAGLPSQ